MPQPQLRASSFGNAARDGNTLDPTPWVIVEFLGALRRGDQLVIDGLYDAFSRGQERATVSFARITGKTAPPSRMMSEQVKALRQWSEGRARAGTSAEARQNEHRKLAA